MYTIELLDSRAASRSLVEAVVDILLIQPVNWDQVIYSPAKVLSTMSSAGLDIFPYIYLLNFGPETGLMGCM